MAGMAGGFLQGFAGTMLNLEELKRKSEYDDGRLAVQKECLGLYRKALDGEIASRKILDKMREVSLEKLLRDMGMRLRSGAVAEDPIGGTLPFGMAAERAEAGDEAPEGGTLAFGPDPETSAHVDLAPAHTEQLLRDYGRRRLAPAAPESFLRAYGRRPQRP